MEMGRANPARESLNIDGRNGSLGSWRIWKAKYLTPTLTAVSIAIGATSLGAQDLTGDSHFDFRLGVRQSSGTSTSPGGTVKTTQAGGILVSAGYVHRLTGDLAVTFSGAFLPAKVMATGDATYGEVERVFSIPLFVGLRLFIPKPNPQTKWRPWVSAEAGPLMGFEVVSSTDRYTGKPDSSGGVGATFALGTRFGLGFDVQLSHFVTFGSSAGYTLIPESLDTGGNQSNHEGLDIGLRLSLLFHDTAASQEPFREGGY